MVISPIFYMGNKKKLVAKGLTDLFPGNIKIFVDAFGGSGVVGMNVQADTHVINDIDEHLYALYGLFQQHSPDDIIKHINDLVDEYGLARERTKRNQYVDKEKMRSDVIFMSKSFEELDYSQFGCDDFVYFDPPYLNSTGNYNDGKRGFKGWSTNDETHLKTIAETLDKQGVKWGISNNVGVNTALLSWATDRKYNVHYIAHKYTNANYHRKNDKTDKEVLITNY